MLILRVLATILASEPARISRRTLPDHYLLIRRDDNFLAHLSMFFNRLSTFLLCGILIGLSSLRLL